MILHFILFMGILTDKHMHRQTNQINWESCMISLITNHIYRWLVSKALHYLKQILCHAIKDLQASTTNLTMLNLLFLNMDKIWLNLLTTSKEEEGTKKVFK